MKNHNYLFLSVFLAELIALFYIDLYPWMEHISKPLITVSLIYIVWSKSRSRDGGRSSFTKLIIIALALSFLGDSFLMYQGKSDNYFILGLASFLLAHVAYSWAFTIPVHKPFDIPLYKKHTWIMIIPYAFAFYVFSELRGHLGDMGLPVLIYVIIISTMLAIALNRYGKVSNASFNWILVGAIFFVASDTVLAINKFHHQINYSSYIIMITYMLAQYSISIGAIKQIREENDLRGS